jgi:hypothetical protein
LSFRSDAIKTTAGHLPGTGVARANLTQFPMQARLCPEFSRWL